MFSYLLGTTPLCSEAFSAIMNVSKSDSAILALLSAFSRGSLPIIGKKPPIFTNYW